MAVSNTTGRHTGDKVVRIIKFPRSLMVITIGSIVIITVMIGTMTGMTSLGVGIRMAGAATVVGTIRSLHSVLVSL